MLAPRHDRVKAIVLAGNGTNCELEMAHACRTAGCDEVDIVHLSELLYGDKRLDDYHFLNLPGGFLDGDDLGAAKAQANRFRHARLEGGGEKLSEQLLRFIEAGKLVLGVCNGFQLMVKLGLLPNFAGKLTQETTLMSNDSGRFEDRWVALRVNDGPCVFTRGLSTLYLPVRHGEGKFVPGDGVLPRMEAERLIVLRYTRRGETQPTQEYPANPNGSVAAVAGVCDRSGRLFGLMPHPEAFLHYTNHPRWTREKNLPEEGDGLAIFRNAAAFIRETLL
ncbi:MAG: phosphoribosylformylglycinamidine synthase subunit PurQ [Pseudomonadota bacterium]